MEQEQEKTKQNKIIKQLVSIQSELKAPKNQYNSFGGYPYRSAEDILEGVKPLLKKAGMICTISDRIYQVGERYYVEATASVINEGGEIFSATASAREPLSKKGMDEAQITGSTGSYAKKYALNNLFAIDDTKDADTDEQHKVSTAKTDKKPTAQSEGKSGYDMAVKAIERAENADTLEDLQKRISEGKKLKKEEKDKLLDLISKKLDKILTELESDDIQNEPEKEEEGKIS